MSRPNILIRALNRFTRMVDNATERMMTSSRRESAGTVGVGMHACPNCIFIWEGDEVIEVIDCQSSLHHTLNEHGWQGPLTGYTNEEEGEKP